jgi:D-serine dehydratase
LAAIARYPQSLALSGIEVYEGVLKDEASIREFLRLAVRELMALEAHSQLAPGQVILTGAGSAWFDLVAEEWTGASLGRPLDIILRPGCYLTHDVGIYKAAEARIHASNPVARSMQTSLLRFLAWASAMPPLMPAFRFPLCTIVQTMGVQTMGVQTTGGLAMKNLLPFQVIGSSPQ